MGNPSESFHFKLLRLWPKRAKRRGRPPVQLPKNKKALRSQREKNERKREKKRKKGVLKNKKKKRKGEKRKTKILTIQYKMVDSSASAGAFAFFDGSRILYTMAIFRIFFTQKKEVFPSNYSVWCRCGKQLEYGLLSAWPSQSRPKLGREIKKYIRRGASYISMEETSDLRI